MFFCPCAWIALHFSQNEGPLKMTQNLRRNFHILHNLSSTLKDNFSTPNTELQFWGQNHLFSGCDRGLLLNSLKQQLHRSRSVQKSYKRHHLVHDYLKAFVVPPIFPI